MIIEEQKEAGIDTIPYYAEIVRLRLPELGQRLRL